MPPPPAPPPPVEDHDAMLSRKFGREVANYFSGSPLNRLGFLRADRVFLAQALRHPSTAFLLCHHLQPLVREGASDRLAFVTYDDVRAVVGDDPYADTEEAAVAQYDSARYVPQMIFLGVDEREAARGLSYQGKGNNVYRGVPYFAVDVTPRSSIKDAAESLIATLKARGLTFAQGRVMDIHASDAAIYAEARQLLDWNLRNPFCAPAANPPSPSTPASNAPQKNKIGPATGYHRRVQPRRSHRAPQLHTTPR
ncbi:putative NADH pyrophosphatase, partial [Teratosphaeria destructans]